ncbi:hypothetical protein J6590_031935 [Homalodisca vitripennis]|nr:hypothetical protein J6590_031935 [Homalodisca vitripennis]
MSGEPLPERSKTSAFKSQLETPLYRRPYTGADPSLFDKTLVQAQDLKGSQEERLHVFLLFTLRYAWRNQRVL